MTKQKGFTIVELLVSTVIFSLILLGAMAALVQIGRLYYKGVTTSVTQEKARSTISEISQSIQFSSQDVTPPNVVLTGPQIPIVEADLGADADDVTAFFCIGPRRYTYAIDRKMSLNPDNTVPVSSRKKEIRHVLWVDEPDGGCAQGASVLPADLTRDDPCDDSDLSSNHDNCVRGRELMEEGMRLSRFGVTQNGAFFNLEITVVNGDDDLLTVENGRYVCEGDRAGLEYCAISELSTTVLKRI